MKVHVMLVGIEHLMTGITFDVKGKARPILFERESPSIVRAVCDEPFNAYWPIKQTWMSSHECEKAEPQPRHSEGEAEWYAQIVAPHMVDEWQRLKDAQYYSRVMGEQGVTGSRLAPNEPAFPDAVIQAAIDKWGKDAHAYLAQMRWAGDYWCIANYKGMYLGIERDGHMHT